MYLFVWYVYTGQRKNKIQTHTRTHLQTHTNTCNTHNANVEMISSPKSDHAHTQYT